MHVVRKQGETRLSRSAPGLRAARPRAGCRAGPVPPCLHGFRIRDEFLGRCSGVRLFQKRRWRQNGQPSPGMEPEQVRVARNQDVRLARQGQGKELRIPVIAAHTCDRFLIGGRNVPESGMPRNQNEELQPLRPWEKRIEFGPVQDSLPISAVSVPRRIR